MSLGKLTNYKALYAPDGMMANLKGPDALAKVKMALSTHSAAMAYFARNPRAVFAGDQSAGADFLISCDRDFMNAVPEGAKYVAFNKQGKMGYVLEDAQKNLTLYDPEPFKSAQPLTYDGLTYEKIAEHGGKPVYARLDRDAINALKASSQLSAANLDAYEAAMRKGVIASGSTGKSGVKFETDGKWVIKLTISDATAQVVDNALSPMAVQVIDAGRIHLNFNALVMRH